MESGQKRQKIRKKWRAKNMTIRAFTVPALTTIRPYAKLTNY